MLATLSTVANPGRRLDLELTGRDWPPTLGAKVSSITQSRRVLGAVLIEPRRIEVVERQLPSIGPTDVLVRVTECGVCASDVDFWLGRSDRQTPAALGHEPAGIVLEVGREVTKFAPGARITCWVEDGGYSQALVTDERYCIPFDDNCAHPFLTEPLACAINAVELAAPSFGDDVVIIGAGFMGNLVQLVAQLRGPRSITVADVRPAALQRALRMGATYAVNTSSEELSERIADITLGRGADIAFEVTGVNAGLDLAEASTRMSGKLCIVGYHQGGTREIRLGHWNWMAFNIVNAHFREKSTILSGMEKAIRLMSADALDVGQLITNVYPLSRIQEAFETAASKPETFVKAIIQTNAPETVASSAVLG